MRLRDWLKPGLRVKRWFAIGIAGVACISYGMAFLVREIYLSPVEKVLASFLILSGCVFIVFSIKYAVRTFFHAVTSSGFKIQLDAERLRSLMYEKRILIRGPKVVAIGGGTGLSTLLRGFKQYSSNITAVVTVADDGGGSGVLRQDLGMLPPGDIRNCVLALADTEPIMQQLLQYRFEEGVLKGQSFGNLFLAAMDGISGSFEEAVRKMSDVLAVTGRVLPVTLQNIQLCAELEDGHVICGESQIGHHHLVHPGRIKRVYLEPADAKPVAEVLEAIREADVVVLGPGSLYTSILPNLLIDGVSDAIRESDAIKVYVSNVMTQPGETEGYSVSEHIKALEQHVDTALIDFCIVNTARIPKELKAAYAADGAEEVRVDMAAIERAGVQVIQGDYLSIANNLVRHNAGRLAETIVDLVAEYVLAQDKKRNLDYYYIKSRIKKVGSKEQKKQELER